MSQRHAGAKVLVALGLMALVLVLLVLIALVPIVQVQVSLMPDVQVPLALVPIALGGMVSGVLYLRLRQWLNAALVLVAAAALGVLVAGLQRPAGAAQTLTITGDPVPERVDQAAAIRLVGDGLSAAVWHDLPARPLQWQPAIKATDATDATDASEPTEPITQPLITLEFPRQLALGRAFTLTLRRSPAPGADAWKLQLLDENQHLLAEAPGNAVGPGTEATARWLPPVAETLLLQARVLSAAGQVLAQGPVPLQVQDAAPLQVQGRLGAPSFDAQALNALLVGSGAVVDWQVTLGKTITRSETARSAMAAPDLIVADAAYLEHSSAAARNAMLAQVAAGAPLLVLATNASDAAFWAQQLQLPLVAQAGDTPRLLKLEGGLELPRSAMTPGTGSSIAASTAPSAARRTARSTAPSTTPSTAPSTTPSTPTAGPWTASHQRQPWLWQRPWQAGRIAWLGVSDWHRYAINNPQALGTWWQAVLDRLQVQHPVDLTWHFPGAPDAPDAMPMVGERSAVCARGARAEMAVRVSMPEPAADQVLHLQRRADSTDAACAALWPRHPGWHTLQAVDGRMPPGRFYAYATTDWPLWQRALRRQATAQYAARAATTPAPRRQPLPAWPAAALFVLAMLGLWWRERR